MEPTDPTEKVEFWREHIRKVALFDGTQGEYSAQNGISASKLSYWKGKLAAKPRFAKVASEIKVTAAPCVTPTEPTARAQPSHPDPAWLAKFVKELLR